MVMERSCNDDFNPQDGDVSSNLGDDGLRAQVAEVHGSLEPEIFAATLDEMRLKSKASVAFGSTSVDDQGCELFEAVGEAVAEATAALAAVMAGELEVQDPST